MVQCPRQLHFLLCKYEVREMWMPMFAFRRLGILDEIKGIL